MFNLQTCSEKLPLVSVDLSAVLVLPMQGTDSVRIQSLICSFLQSHTIEPLLFALADKRSQGPAEQGGPASLYYIQLGAPHLPPS